MQFILESKEGKWLNQMEKGAIKKGLVLDVHK